MEEGRVFKGGKSGRRGTHENGARRAAGPAKRSTLAQPGAQGRARHGRIANQNKTQGPERKEEPSQAHDSELGSHEIHRAIAFADHPVKLKVSRSQLHCLHELPRATLQCGRVCCGGRSAAQTNTVKRWQGSQCKGRQHSLKVWSNSYCISSGILVQVFSPGAPQSCTPSRAPDRRVAEALALAANRPSSPAR